MNYVNVKVLPTPHKVEFKCVGGLIFDINYVGYSNSESKTWFNSKGQFHRENGPAIIWNDGEQWWCRYGKYHREDGPVAIWPDGSQYWYLNDIGYSERDFNKEIRRRNELRKRKSLTNTPQY